MAASNVFDACRATGLLALQYSKKWLEDPVATTSKFAGILSERATMMPFEAHGDFNKKSLLCTSILSGRWAMSGFPVVTLGHRTAAALMATKLKPDDAEEFVRVPWPAFGIRLPTPLLTVEDNGVYRDIPFLLVTSVEAKQCGDRWPGAHRWWYRLYGQGAERAGSPIAESANTLSLWGFNMPTGSLATPDMRELDGFERFDTRPQVSSDERSETLARLLIAAVCLHLSGDPRERANRNSEDGIKVSERKSKKRAGDELPQYTEFELHLAIKINLHHAMRDYVSRGGSVPTVQSLVPGHWKRVVYGAGRSQRRVQHILPYWRGQLDAPISTRNK